MSESLAGRLSPRERQCMLGVAAHKRSKDISAETGLKEKTVDAYIASAVRKLGYADRDSAIRALIKEAPEAWGFSPEGKTDVAIGPELTLVRVLGRLPWPFPTQERPENDLGPAFTLVAVIIAASVLIAGFSLFMMLIYMLTG